MTDEIEGPLARENQPLTIYDARLTFRKTREGEKVLTVTIRYLKKGCAKKERFSFPEDIRDDDLVWISYHGEKRSVYHRRGAYKYIDLNSSLVRTSLGQKLERLVLEALETNQKSMETNTEIGTLNKNQLTKLNN